MSPILIFSAWCPINHKVHFCMHHTQDCTNSKPWSFIYAIISIVSVIMRLPTEVSSRDCNTSGHNTRFTSSRKRKTKQKHCSACLGSLHVTCMCVAGSHNRCGDSNRALVTLDMILDTNWKLAWISCYRMSRLCGLASLLCFSRSPWFRSRPRNWLSWLRLFVVFLSICLGKRRDHTLKKGSSVS